MKRERLEEVAELLDKRGKMTLEQLEEAFPDVSQMTLRRDLSQLEAVSYTHLTLPTKLEV